MPGRLGLRGLLNSSGPSFVPFLSFGRAVPVFVFTCSRFIRVRVVSPFGVWCFGFLWSLEARSRFIGVGVWSFPFRGNFWYQTLPLNLPSTCLKTTLSALAPNKKTNNVICEHPIN